MFDDARRMEQEDETCARTVHDRNFGGGDFNHAVVDPETAQGAHQVFDRRNGRRPDVDGGRHAGVVHVEGFCGNIDGRIDVSAAVDDPRVGCRREKPQLHLAARMKPDADGFDGFAQGALLEVGHDSLPSRRSFDEGRRCVGISGGFFKERAARPFGRKPPLRCGRPSSSGSKYESVPREAFGPGPNGLLQLLPERR